MISCSLAHVVERDRAPGERVAGRAGEHDGVAEERLVLDAAVARRRADDAELQRAVGDALDDRLRVEDAERDVQRRVQLGELAEELREHDAARARSTRRSRSVPSSAPVASSASSLTISSSSASSRCAER